MNLKRKEKEDNKKSKKVFSCQLFYETLSMLKSYLIRVKSANISFGGLKGNVGINMIGGT